MNVIIKINNDIALNNFKKDKSLIYNGEHIDAVTCCTMILTTSYFHRKKQYIIDYLVKTC